MALSGSYNGSTSLSVEAVAAGAAGFSHIVSCTESSLCEQAMPAASSLADASKSVPTVSFEELEVSLC